MAVTEELFLGSPVAGLGEEDKKSLVGGRKLPSDAMGRACLKERFKGVKVRFRRKNMLGEGRTGICLVLAAFPSSRVSESVRHFRR